MITLDAERLRDALNADPEFTLNARHWNMRLSLRVGDRQYILEIREGKVAQIDPAPTIFEPWDVQVTGPEDGWEKLLRQVPPPFYQDLFPAMLHQGFTIGGDLEGLFAYYPAVRRMVDVMRDLRASAA